MRPYDWMFLAIGIATILLVFGSLIYYEIAQWGMHR